MNVQFNFIAHYSLLDSSIFFVLSIFFLFSFHPPPSLLPLPLLAHFILNEHAMYWMVFCTVFFCLAFTYSFCDSINELCSFAAFIDYYWIRSHKFELDEWFEVGSARCNIDMVIGRPNPKWSYRTKPNRTKQRFSIHTAYEHNYYWENHVICEINKIIVNKWLTWVEGFSICNLYSYCSELHMKHV